MLRSTSSRQTFVACSNSAWWRPHSATRASASQGRTTRQRALLQLCARGLALALALSKTWDVFVKRSGSTCSLRTSASLAPMALASRSIDQGCCGRGSHQRRRRIWTKAHDSGARTWTLVVRRCIRRSSVADSEQMINSFAIHFLAPRAGVTKVWSENSDLSLRDRALTVGVAFRLSWSAAISQLRNVGLISYEDRDRLSTNEPRFGDYLRLGLSWKDELEAPYLSPAFVAACLTGYTSSTLTESRVLELLRGMLSANDLPALDIVVDGRIPPIFRRPPRLGIGCLTRQRGLSTRASTPTCAEPDTPRFSNAWHLAA